MWILLDRNRGGAYLAAALAIAGMFGAFLFLTYYLQVVLRYSPLQAGLAFLPLTQPEHAATSARTQHRKMDKSFTVA